jgi:hypothetical protein
VSVTVNATPARCVSELRQRLASPWLASPYMTDIEYAKPAILIWCSRMQLKQDNKLASNNWGDEASTPKLPGTSPCPLPSVLACCLWCLQLHIQPRWRSKPSPRNQHLHPASASGSTTAKPGAAAPEGKSQLATIQDRLSVSESQS